MNDLDDLAASINVEHHGVQRAVEDALGHAMNAGTLLLDAKSRIEHGGWLPWLCENTQVSARTAQVYMRLAENKERFGNTQHAALLSIRAAERLLSEPTTTEDDATTPEQIDAEWALADWLVVNSPDPDSSLTPERMDEHKASYTAYLDTLASREAQP
jgi:hypothetical protein